MTDESPAPDDQRVDQTPDQPAELEPKQMLEREQQMAYGLAGLAVVASVAVLAAGPGTWLTLLLGLVAAAGLVLSARRGHRIITAFVAMAVGFVIPFLPLELLALVFAGFIMLRASRAQAKINASKPRLTPAERAELRRQGREARRSGSGGSSGSSGSGHSEGTSASAARRPTASRRYTPPKSNARRR